MDEQTCGSKRADKYCTVQICRMQSTYLGMCVSPPGLHPSLTLVSMCQRNSRELYQTRAASTHFFATPSDGLRHKPEDWQVSMA